MKIKVKRTMVNVYHLKRQTEATYRYKISDLRNKASKFMTVHCINTLDKIEIIKIQTPKKTKTYYWLVENKFITGDGRAGSVCDIEEKPLFEVELIKEILDNSRRWIVKRKLN